MKRQRRRSGDPLTFSQQAERCEARMKEFDGMAKGLELGPAHLTQRYFFARSVVAWLAWKATDNEWTLALQQASEMWPTLSQPKGPDAGPREQAQPQEPGPKSETGEGC